MAAPSSTRRAVLGLAAVLLALPATVGCTSARGAEGPEVVAESGLEQAHAAGWRPTRAGDVLRDGTRVRTRDRDGALRYSDGEVVLGPDAAAVVQPDGVGLVRGEALVRSAGGLTASYGDARVSGSGTFRVSTGVAAVVRVYNGMARVDVGGTGEDVAAWRELPIGVLGAADGDRPLSYRADDPWDQEMAGEALAFDREADAVAAGIALRWGADPRPEAFYARFADGDPELLAVLPATAPTVDSSGAYGPPAIALLALVVASAVDAPTGTRTSADALRAVAALRGEGAPWGLVAVALGVERPSFSEAVDLVLPALAEVGSGVPAPLDSDPARRCAPEDLAC